MDNEIKKSKEQIIEERKQLIMNSGIDFKSRGWKQQVTDLLGIARVNALHWMKIHMKDFYLECWHQFPDKEKERLQ